MNTTTTTPTRPPAGFARVFDRFGPHLVQIGPAIPGRARPHTSPIKAVA